MTRSILPHPVGLAVAATLLLGLFLLPLPLAAAAQTDLGAQTLGRAYWHVFTAYAIAWLLVMGWIVSIGRRLADVERRLEG